VTIQISGWAGGVRRLKGAAMIQINGAIGEGGGQIVRTSLALSLVTGKAFKIRNIRANRKKPGLMRQHLTALEAAARIGKAQIQGRAIGSHAFVFEPGAVQPGRFHFAVGSAGSCTLVLQTVLPALLLAGGPSEVILEGGTHNPHAPSFEFLQSAFLPLLNRMGPSLSAELQRPGFYPAGGGRIQVAIEPAPGLKPIELLERGRIRSRSACAMVSNLPLSIARRELKIVAERLQWEPEVLKATEIRTAEGPGNILTIAMAGGTLTEVFTGFGQRGLSAETVAGRTVEMVQEYLQHDLPVGRHLADQLLIPLALAGGGRFRTLSPSRHTTTNIAVIEQFLEVKIGLNRLDDNGWEVAVTS
jgi:RNA 3'-terminal phosphate cyclase (ATP)